MRYTSSNEETTQLSITIYNGGFGLVKESRKLFSNENCSEIQYIDVAEKIEIDSIIVTGLHILEFNFDHDLVSRQKLLEKYLDQVVTVFDKIQSIRTEIRLLSVTDGIIGERSDTKEIVINPAGELILPSLPNGLIVKPTLIWMIKNQQLNQDINVSYLTKGMSWEANYVLELADNTFNLTGWVCIDNQSGTTFKEAVVKVIAGDVNRVDNFQPLVNNERVYSSMVDFEDEEEFTEKSFADQHMYSLGRKVTLKDHQKKQINFLNITNGKYKKYYCVDKYSSKAEIIIEIMNTVENQMGIPIPKGMIKVYQADVSDKLLEFIGEDHVDHTPKNEVIKLGLGKAFDIITKGREKKRYKLSQREYVEFEYEITNYKEEKVAVKIEHYISDRHWVIDEATHEFVQEDGQNISFWVDVEPEGKTFVSFRYCVDNSINVNLA
ncbi:DUF4139 domain-containing protein [Anaerobacillus sp. MEB173]|uniref:DUF4139 domain-containing protein n=1 Tax=Anaerobacillus sp. MEB173 TaxID=3383345 RepID=UPI003F90A494